MRINELLSKVDEPVSAKQVANWIKLGILTPPVYAKPNQAQYSSYHIGQVNCVIKLSKYFGFDVIKRIASNHNLNAEWVDIFVKRYRDLLTTIEGNYECDTCQDRDCEGCIYSF